jgi:Putative citrate transport
MGANTYIGNGPNFMVKSIAEKQGIKMPIATASVSRLNKENPYGSTRLFGTASQCPRLPLHRGSHIPGDRVSLEASLEILRPV